MMAVVMERRKEIGLKALGASNKSIVTDFLGEGAIRDCRRCFRICFGYVFAQQVSMSVFARKVSFWTLVPITIIVFGNYNCACVYAPVSKAVDVEPALVLRGE